METEGKRTGGRPTQPGSAGPGAPLVAVIVVNWNGAADSIEGLASLERSQFRNWRLVIVDNASSDDSVARLRALGDRVTLVESEVNLGFAGGCNLGLAHARRLGADYAFLLNNDASVTPETLGQLLADMRSLGDRAAIGPVIRFEDGALQFHGTIKSKWGHSIWLQPSEERLAASPPLIPTDFIVGAGLMAPMSLFEAVGDFDERFFLNFEEMDWCYRAAARGFDCFVSKAALVIHKGSASLGSLDSPFQVYFRSRNELLFLEKHRALVPWTWAFTRLLRRIAGRVVATLKGDASARSSAEIRVLALRDYVLRRFGDCPGRIRELARLRSQADADRTLIGGKVSA